MNEMYPHMIECDPPKEETFVRVIVNDGVVAIPGCNGGESGAGESKEGEEGAGGEGRGKEEGPRRPRGACGLREWEEMVERRAREVGDFREVCGLGENAAPGITFWHH
jgi:acid phosphatase